MEDKIWAGGRVESLKLRKGTHHSDLFVVISYRQSEEECLHAASK
jgi:hypothetical protein